jgi:hypothetical protein
MEVYVW